MSNMKLLDLQLGVHLEVSQQSVRRTRILLIIGAGRGTTGAHLMTQATCHLGYPSMHWNVGCIPHDPQ